MIDFLRKGEGQLTPIADAALAGHYYDMEEAGDPMFDALIPELKAWNNGDGIDAEGWIGCVGSVELAIGYSLIFWPQFIRFDDYIVRDGLGNASYLEGWAEQCNGDKSAVERVVNHIHIVDLHAVGAGITEAQARYLERTLKQIHEVKLTSDFPNAKFEVFFNDEPNLDLLDYQITFWQIG